jgi:hypothetical protein
MHTTGAESDSDLFWDCFEMSHDVNYWDWYIIGNITICDSLAEII